MTFLEGRFGEIPPPILVEAIESVVNEKQLKDLVRSAGACPDLDAFRPGGRAGLTVCMRQLGTERITFPHGWPHR